MRILERDKEGEKNARRRTLCGTMRTFFERDEVAAQKTLCKSSNYDRAEYIMGFEISGKKAGNSVNAFLKNLRWSLEASIRSKKQMLSDNSRMESFADAVKAVVACYRQGGRLYIAGNGGSAADAQHLATEFVVKLSRPRQPLPAEALTVDSSTLTAISNDFGFEEVFARQIEGKMTRRDVFLAITTSGNSPNILRSFEKCRELGIKSVLFSGRDGGKARKLADVCVIATGEDTSRIQEIHSVLCHSLCQCVEEVMFPKLTTQYVVEQDVTDKEKAPSLEV